MKFQILTIFPELFDSFKNYGLVRKAIGAELIQVETINLRDFAINNQGQIDDSPYGGGSGMLLRVEPASEAITKAKANDPKAKVILLSPKGAPFTQKKAKEFEKHHRDTGAGLILLTPRYEGVDHRITENLIDEEISLGDFILMGGEVASMSVIEATARLLPSVLGNPESTTSESFESCFLEYPQYTKPNQINSWSVPEVLTSGDHKKIAEWREEKALEDTIRKRPDLINKTKKEKACELSVALIHYPVLDKQGEIITSSITNIDLHDIARSATTFGFDNFYVIHPTKTLRLLNKKILEHWASEFGQKYNGNRSEALEKIKVFAEFDDAILEIETRTKKLPKIITTSAKKSKNSTSFPELKARLLTATEPHLLLLGTGWGLAPEILERADYHLEPINGPGEYNHLSVRSAAAIMMDRLFAG